ncbi:hypothetical protein H4582DRAFT_1111952 [Lactarius indigo]|nr:hypothetical protein H4582DRAFT_1111952 [Lactarius indigo]
MEDGHPIENNLEAHVLSKAFDEECAAFAVRRHRLFSLNDSDTDPDVNSLYSNDSTSSSDLSVESSPYDVPKFEACLYYAGVSGPRGRCPKLVYRTTREKEKYVLPTGPEEYCRLMKLRTVPEDHKLGEDNLWDTIRAEVVKVLDERSIKLTSVDLVRFTWTEESDDREIVESEESEVDEEDEGSLNYDDIAHIKPVVYGTVYTTPATIWVGVMPDTLTGEVAHYSANDILELLKKHGITDVEVTYRESVAKSLAGPELFPPASYFDPLKDVIDNLSTALSLPIAGLKTKMQGTLGFYFRVGDELYAVTARHVLFKDSEPNDEYNYVAGPKKEVVVMRPNAFTNYLASIQGHIGRILIDTVDPLEKHIAKLTRRVEAGGDDAQKSAGQLAETQRDLTELRTKIEALKQYFVKVKTKWGKLKDRIIGHVVWAPPISVATPPHLFTKDLCVIKLVKDKFTNLRNNVLSLGPEISQVKFRNLMYDWFDAAHEFEYPYEGLFKLQGILSDEEIRKPDKKTLEGDPNRRVIKRGSKTLTTVGGLSGYLSHVRRYFPTGEINSTEVAVHPYSNESGPFSWGGDSGSIIVDVVGRYVALLTGGTGKIGSSDITFGTPMFWLWTLILAKFPGANLYWDDDN